MFQVLKKELMVFSWTQSRQAVRSVGCVSRLTTLNLGHVRTVLDEGRLLGLGPQD